MKITKSQILVLFFGLLFLGSGSAVEGNQQDISAQQEKKEMKQKGMKQKVKSYSEVVLEQAEALNLTDQQLGKILRIQMTNKKIRKELLAKPHKSMKKALKELRNPAADAASVRKAARVHTNDFDALAESELKVRKAINDALTAKQRAKLKAIKLPDEEK